MIEPMGQTPADREVRLDLAGTALYARRRGDERVRDHPDSGIEPNTDAAPAGPETEEPARRCGPPRVSADSLIIDAGAMHDDVHALHTAPSFEEDMLVTSTDALAPMKAMERPDIVSRRTAEIEPSDAPSTPGEWLPLTQGPVRQWDVLAGAGPSLGDYGAASVEGPLPDSPEPAPMSHGAQGTVPSNQAHSAATAPSDESTAPEEAPPVIEDPFDRLRRSLRQSEAEQRTRRQGWPWQWLARRRRGRGEGRA